MEFLSTVRDVDRKSFPERFEETSLSHKNFEDSSDFKRTDAITRKEIFYKNWQQTQQFLRWGKTVGVENPSTNTNGEDNKNNGIFFTDVSPYDGVSRRQSITTKILLQDQLDPVLYYLEHMTAILREELEQELERNSSDLNEMDDSMLSDSEMSHKLFPLSTMLSRPTQLSLNSRSRLTNTPPILAFALQESIFPKMLHWCLQASGDMLERVKIAWLQSFETLVSLGQTELLSHQEVLCPLLHLVHVCGMRSSVSVERHLVSLLHQLCILLTHNQHPHEANNSSQAWSSSREQGHRMQHWTPPLFHQVWHLSNEPSSLLFLSSAATSGQLQHDSSWKRRSWQKQQTKLAFGCDRSAATTPVSRGFLPLNLLIPFMHREGDIGHQARSGLLVLMTLAADDAQFAYCVVESSDFAPVLATGLSALYSLLPRKLPFTDGSGDDWQQLNDQDIAALPDLKLFLTSLHFCNAVLKISHPLIKRHVVNLILSGFLVPVMGSALHQSSLEEVVAATAYMELFLRHIDEPQLLRLFLRFLLLDRHDNYSILDSLITRINSNTTLGIITLSLFNTILSFHSEDVLYHLILRYLIPCRHIVPTQIQAEIIRGNSLAYSTSADKFLSLVASPPCEGITSNNEEYVHNNRSCNNNERFNKQKGEESLYHHYLYDASTHIDICHTASRVWHFAYDGLDPPLDCFEKAPPRPPLSSSEGDEGDIDEDDDDDDDDANDDDLDNSSILSHDFDSVSLRGEQQQQQQQSRTTIMNKKRTLKSNYERRSQNVNLMENSKKGNIFQRYQTQQKNSFNEDETFVVDECDNISLDSLDPSSHGPLFSNMDDLDIGDRSSAVGGKMGGPGGYGSDDTMTEFESSSVVKRMALLHPDEEEEEGDGVNDSVQHGRPNESSIGQRYLQSMYTLSYFDEMELASDMESVLMTARSKLPHADANNSSKLADDGIIPTTTTSSAAADCQSKSTTLALHLDVKNSLINSALWSAESTLPQFMEALDACCTAPAIDFSTNQHENPFYNFDTTIGKLSPKIVEHIEKEFGRPELHQNEKLRHCESGGGLRRRESNLTSVDESESQCLGPSVSISTGVDCADSGRGDSTQSDSLPPMSSSALAKKIGQLTSLDAKTMSGSVHGGGGGGSYLCNSTSAPTVGPFLTTLLCKLESMPGNSVYVNLLVTGLISQLAAYPQPLLRSLLLNTNLTLQPTIKSLYQILSSVRCRIDNFAMHWNESQCARTHPTGEACIRPGGVGVGGNKSDISRKSALSMRAINRRLSTTHMDNSLAVGDFAALVDKAEGYLRQRAQGDFKSTSAPGEDNLLTLRSAGMASLNKDQSDAAERSASSTRINSVQPRRVTGGFLSLFTRNRRATSQIAEPVTSPTPPRRDSLLAAKQKDSFQERLEAVRLRNMVYGHVILNEFCQELSALCREHSVRPK